MHRACAQFIHSSQLCSGLTTSDPKLLCFMAKYSRVRVHACILQPVMLKGSQPHILSHNPSQVQARASV